MSIERVGRISLSDQVLEQMKNLILSHEWPTTYKLPSEGELSEMFGVSRVTIRNALHRLVGLGLIETRLGDGSYVAQIDESSGLNNLIPVVYLEENLASILEFRREFESGACAIAAGRAEAEDIADLRRLLEKMLTLQNDRTALAEADLEFHYRIAEITRNSLFIKTYEIISEVYAAHMKRVVHVIGGEAGRYYHAKIVDAIEAGDAEEARKVMYEHIASNNEVLHTEKE
ncbi:FadR/GntR family transcriptional regulator [Oscillospiraceae bacterium MB08-C2-2]|nr:FadR/GntR family transcriptional regulator [Oscillospiraceae bacterium MB08-C2-2]